MSQIISKATLVLVAKILNKAAELDLAVERVMENTSSLPENSGYVKVRVDGGSAELNIPKGHAAWMDSHVDWVGKAGYIPLTKPNGTVVCRIDPAKADIGALLTALSGASKPERKTSSTTASQAASDEFIASLKALGFKKAEQPNGIHPPVDTTDEEPDGEYVPADAS